MLTAPAEHATTIAPPLPAAPALEQAPRKTSTKSAEHAEPSIALIDDGYAGPDYFALGYGA